jgi:hypothetical protein
MPGSLRAGAPTPRAGRSSTRCNDEGLGPLVVIGDFVLPPMEGRKTRDFQTLHFGFGLPLDPKVDQDVEGSLARVIEAPAGTSPRLPSVKEDPDFRRGLVRRAVRRCARQRKSRSGTQVCEHADRLAPGVWA